MSKRCLTCGMHSSENKVLRIKNQKLEAENQRLRDWQELAFDVHPNIDLDIEALKEKGDDK